MQSNWWLTASWCLGIVLNLAILAVILRRGLMRHWSSLFLYCSLSLAVDVLLATYGQSYLRFFWIYWGWASLAAVLRMWILTDVIRSFPGTNFITRQVRLLMAVAAGFIAFGAWVLSSTAGTPLYQHLQSFTLLLNRNVAFAWTAFLLAALFAIRVLGVGWDRTGAIIVNGFVVKIVGWLCSSSIFTLILHHQAQLLGQFAESFTSTACLAIWLYALATRETDRQLNLRYSRIAINLNVNHLLRQAEKADPVCN